MILVEWSTPLLVRQFTELKIAGALDRRAQNLKTLTFIDESSERRRLLYAVVRELRYRNVLD